MLPNLSAAELDLLKKLGIKLPKQKNPLLDRAPKPIRLEKISGKVVTSCKCCGFHNETYIDYLKRKDCEGYYTVSVSTPSFPVKRMHTYDVTVCPHCATLEEFPKEKLMEMITNLRMLLRKEK